MRKALQRWMTLLTALVLMLSASGAAMAEDELTFDTLGKKTAEALTMPGEYEITLSVPGAVSSDEYSEIIVMTDASYSMDDDNYLELIAQLGEEVLKNDGTTRLTLMGFGVGPKYAGSFYNMETLTAFLAEATPADLYQERSATNCEVGFEFVENYIESSSRLRKTCVVYLSDAAVNLSEIPMDFSTWRDTSVWDYFKSWTADMLCAYAIDVELGHIFSGASPLPATVEMQPEACMAIELAKLRHGAGSEEHKAAVDALGSALTQEQEAYIDALLQHIYAESGYVYGTDKPSASDIEKVFQTYYRKYVGKNDKAYGSYMDLFYVILGDTGRSAWVQGAERAAEACDRLAQMEKVMQLYLVGYDGSDNRWMNPAKGMIAASDKITYVSHASFSGAIESLLTHTDEMLATIYRDVTVTDPMSKWVDLDVESIRICKDNETVWTYNDGWLISDPPTASPVAVSKMEDGRQQITWLIKDGLLLYTDRYSLKYIVNVDETAEGFEYGVTYPANDPTSVEYVDENGVAQTNNIPVPDVKENAPPQDISKGLRIYKSSSVTNKPISDVTFTVYSVMPEAGEMISEIPTSEEIAKYMQENNKVGSTTTNGAGYATLTLEDGFYLVVEEHNETKVKTPVDPFYVMIPMADPETGELLNVVTVYPKNIPVDAEGEELLPPVIPEEPEPESPVGRFTILKHSASNETAVLNGAQFQVFRPATDDDDAENMVTILCGGEEYSVVPVVADGQVVVLTTGEDGTVVSPALPFGLYFLVETQAPAGYELAEEATAVLVASNTDDEMVQIANKPGVLLPSTGGRGAWMYTTAGVILCSAAVLLLIRRKYFVR